ncbi:MAG: hypothetical protein WAU49_15825 [Steroidobacteraceae bacterium]
MMTLKRLQKLADSYGADLRRWPQRLHPRARTLLESSAQAREIMAGASEIDQAIGAAAIARSEDLWSRDRPEAALARLRNGVAARIGRATSVADEALIRAARGGPGRVRWISLATAASVAILAGVVLGIVYSPAASHQDLLALLQPGPIQLLND